MRLLKRFRPALICLMTTSRSVATPIYSGLIGYWPFNGSGTDDSGGGYNLTVTGGATYAPGLFGQALSLDGVEGSSAVGSGDDPAFNFGSSDFSVQVWANFASSGGIYTLVEKFTGGNGPGWTLSTIGNDLQFWSLPTVDLNGGVSIQTGVWQQFVVTRSGDTFSLYYDGSLATSATAAGALPASTNPLLIGARNAEDGRNYTVDGLIDEVGIWDRTLSASEVSDLWNGGLANLSCRSRRQWQ
jgi:hypothetical protein